MVYKHADAAWRDGAIAVAMLTEFMSDWRAEESRWSDHVVKTVAAESEANKALVSDWASRWIDRAIERGPAAALLDDGGKACACRRRRAPPRRAPARSASTSNRGKPTWRKSPRSRCCTTTTPARSSRRSSPTIRRARPRHAGRVKLDRDMELVVNRASVEERLGRAWDPQEIHLVLVSMAGNLDEDDDHFTVSWKH